MVPQTQVTWFVKVGLLIGACLLVGGLLRSCVNPDPPPDPTQAVRDSAQRAHAADSVRWAAQREALTGTVARLEAQRDSLRNRRNAKPVVVYVREPGTENNSSSGDGLSDSTPMVHLADYQSLERENALADTVIATQAAIIRADSAAYAALGMMRMVEDSLHRVRTSALERDLSRARRGPRFLGLPVPQLGVGYCATVTAGAVRTGPCVSVSIPVKL